MSSPILDAALRYAEQGASLVLLRSRSKAPVEMDWASRPFLAPAELRERWRNHNIGVRLGEPSKIGRFYLHAFDLDIRDPRRSDEAWAALTALFPDADRCAAVVSGSGGESRHLYFLTDKPFRKRNIAKSPDMVKLPSGESKRAWEIDLYGTGAQVVLPPSIHPVTERKYRWLDDEPKLKTILVIKSANIERVLAEKPSAATRAKEREREPFDLDDLERVLFDVPKFDNRGAGLDYEDWLGVVFAVHDHYDGDEDEDDAYDLLDEWSAQCDKYDEKNLRRVYDAIRDDDHEVRITIASLVKALRDHDSSPEVRRKRWDRAGIGFKDETATVRRMEEEDRERERTEAATRREVEKAREQGEIHPEEWRVDLEKDAESVPIFTPDAFTVLFEKHPLFRSFIQADLSTGVPVWVFQPGMTALTNRIGVTRDEPVRAYDVGDDYLNVLDLVREVLPQWANKRNLVKTLINDVVFRAARTILPKCNRMERTFFSVKWDGVKRVERLFIDYLGAEDDEAGYARAAARHFCMGIAGRVMKPGMKFDEAFVLQGVQGCGKDTFLENLVGFANTSYLQNHVTDLFDATKYVPLVEGRAIVHFNEMHAMSRKAVEQLRAFITNTADSYIPKYRTQSRDVKRTFVIVATTNDQTFLPDDAAGNRRYLPIICGDPKPVEDAKGRTAFTGYAKSGLRDLPREREQIWAEAREMVLDLEGEAPKMPSRVMTHLNALRSETTVMTGEQEIAQQLVAWVDEPVAIETLCGRQGRKALDDPEALAIRNQFTRREAWDATLGQEPNARYDPYDARFTRAVQRVKGFEPARTSTERVFRRRGTNGRPTLINPDAEDASPAETRKVVHLDDERDKRRSIL